MASGRIEEQFETTLNALGKLEAPIKISGQSARGNLADDDSVILAPLVHTMDEMWRSPSDLKQGKSADVENGFVDGAP